MEDKNLSASERRRMFDESALKRNKVSTKSSSSYSNEQAVEQRKDFVKQYMDVSKSNLSEQEKKLRYIAIMDAENRTKRYKKKISDLDSSGHNRNFQSTDESSSKTFTKGLTKDYTAPNLGVHARSQRFEGKPRRPLDLDGGSDNEEKAYSDLEVPVGEGLERALGNPNNAPEISTRIQDTGPDTNPLSSQRED